jgi:hypothetical protein
MRIYLRGHETDHDSLVIGQTPHRLERVGTVGIDSIQKPAISTANIASTVASSPATSAPRALPRHVRMITVNSAGFRLPRPRQDRCESAYASRYHRPPARDDEADHERCIADAFLACPAIGSIVRPQRIGRAGYEMIETRDGSRPARDFHS